MSNADVDDERTGIGGVGLLIRSGAVARGGLGIGVDGDGGTLNLALAGEPVAPAVKCESSSSPPFKTVSSCEIKSVGVTGNAAESWCKDEQ